jgi:hypothetical protein
VIYYLDEIRLSGSPDSDWVSLGYHILAVGEVNSNTSVKAIRVYGFTYEPDMYDFAYSQGIPLAKHEAAASHLRGYADSSGAIEVYEETESVSQSYLDYESAYLDSLENAGKREEITAAGFIYKNCATGSGASLPYLTLDLDILLCLQDGTIQYLPTFHLAHTPTLDFTIRPFIGTGFLDGGVQAG